MKSRIIKFSCICAAALLSACSSSPSAPSSSIIPGGYSIEGKGIYLRGEMNDYEVSESYRLRKQDDYGYCTLAKLRSDWAPYKFKFADEKWSAGTNFGYMTPPGAIREGSKALELNPFSKFEELVFYPKEDGIYRFCLIENDGKYLVTVEKSSHHSLLSMSQLFKMSKSRVN